MRIIIAADNASSRFGGEAFIPLNYFRLLLARKEDVRLVVHARNRSELTELFPKDLHRLFFVNDTMLHKALFRFGHFLPRRLADATTGFLIHLSTQFVQRRKIRELTRAHPIDVVHVPIPVSPKTPSLMWGLNAAIVIGPLNGGMEYPAAFRRERGPISDLAFRFGRSLAHLVNALVPGKLRADIVLVANPRTRKALPDGITGQIIQLVENGVDFSIWQKTNRPQDNASCVRLIFVGRLIDWKALDVIFEALVRMRDRLSVSLEIIGEGPMGEYWQAAVKEKGLGPIVSFRGWLSQSACAARMRQADVFVLPSLFECGGAVVLEAMAMGLPVIATDWGGPADYIDESCGILVKPCSRDALVAGFADAMTKLAMSKELRTRLGAAGHARAREHFGWDGKVDRILKIYEAAVLRRKQRPANR
jgi:glycosyltransferase involved in cell wall biosynthesis